MIAGDLHWECGSSVVSQLHADPTEAVSLVQAVALPNSAALRPFHVLSRGEKARAGIARRLGMGRNAGGEEEMVTLRHAGSNGTVRAAHIYQDAFFDAGKICNELKGDRNILGSPADASAFHILFSPMSVCQKTADRHAGR